jgi:hypothetical protein
MWREARKLVIDVGAAFVGLLNEPLDDPETERIIASEVRLFAPYRPRAGIGTELWALLTDYHLRMIQRNGGFPRRESSIAVVAMAVEEMISIDDIDPRDVFGY